jgi:hypothetical protein
MLGFFSLAAAKPEKQTKAAVIEAARRRARDVLI